jgi:hypothetical protein
MENTRSRRPVILSLLIVLALSAYLRLLGISWGLGSGYGHYLNFHPDEYISIRGILPIRPMAGKLQAPDAYFEGTFNYYLWAVPEMLRELRGEAPLPAGEGEQNLTADQFKFVLLSGRLMSVAFDLATVVLLFAIIHELTGQAVVAVLGALLYGVIPMQVIYSHFMRTYTLSNLLCVLVIWLSIKALKHRHWWLFVVTGLAAGLAAATRYPAAVVLSVPFVLLLLRGDAPKEPWRQRFRKSVVYLLSGPVWLLGVGFILGLFLGEPMLLFDSQNVAREIFFEMYHYAPAEARNPFDMAPIWKYVSVLIPYATYPILCLLIYLSILYVLVRPSVWPAAVPLCTFAVLYTYAMAKGYHNLYARLTMLLLPAFCVIVGVAFGQVRRDLVNRPVLFRIVIIVTILVIIPSVLFDWAYGQAMRERDAREMLRNDLQEFIRDRAPTTIGVSEGGYYFYTVMPAVFPLKSNNVAVELESALTRPADFFVMGFGWPLPEKERNRSIRQVEDRGTLKLVKTYSQAPSIFGKKLDLSTFPPDMTYPFPTVLLFRKVTHDLE